MRAQHNQKSPVTTVYLYDSFNTLQQKTHGIPIHCVPIHHVDDWRITRIMLQGRSTMHDLLSTRRHMLDASAQPGKAGSQGTRRAQCSLKSISSDTES